MSLNKSSPTQFPQSIFCHSGNSIVLQFTVQLFPPFFRIPNDTAQYCTLSFSTRRAPSAQAILPACVFLLLQRRTRPLNSPLTLTTASRNIVHITALGD